jgi:hypothetical protein
MKNTACKSIAFIAAAFAALAVAMLPATARSGGGHPGNNASPQPSTVSRDASAGQAHGRRQYKPIQQVTPTAKRKSRPARLTPDKVEAGSENVR